MRAHTLPVGNGAWCRDWRSRTYGALRIVHAGCTQGRGDIVRTRTQPRARASEPRRCARTSSLAASVDASSNGGLRPRGR